MTKEEALKIVRENYPHFGTTEPWLDLEKALATLIPELAESDDERVRKWILEKVQGYARSGIPCSDEIKMADKAIAYLENQKEHQSCPDAPKEKKLGSNFYPSDKDKNLDEIAQDYVDGVKEYNSEPTWDLVQTAVCYGYHLSEEQFEKNRLAHCDAVSKEECDRETDFAMEIIEKEHRQPTFNDAINYGMRLHKEQKPVEYLSKRKVYDIMNKLTELSMSELIPLESEEYIKIHEITSDVCSLLDYPIKQKPAERSLEDDHIIGFVYDLLNEIEWKDNWAMSKEECLRLLSNYIPQKPAEKQDYSGLNDLERAILRGFLAAGMDNVPVTVIKETAKECLAQTKPAEWSEDDEANKTCILESLEDRIKDVDGVYYAKRLRTAQNWLKSLPERFNLQPKEEWSEEDEEIFNNIIEKAKGGHWIEVNEITWLITRFKSLRPQGSKDSLQTHWKPSEEWNEEDKQYFDDLIARIEKSRRTNRCYVYTDDVDWLKSKLNGNSGK